MEFGVRCSPLDLFLGATGVIFREENKGETSMQNSTGHSIRGQSVGPDLLKEVSALPRGVALLTTNHLQSPLRLNF